MEENIQSEAEVQAEPEAITPDADAIWNADPFKESVDDEVDPSAPVPLEEEVKEEAETEEKTEDEPAEAETKESVETEEEDDEVPDEKQSVKRHSRTQLRKIDEKLLGPLDDPDAPIVDVIQALTEFNPLRTEELFRSVINESAKQHPDQWLQAILGMPDITVDSLKAKFSEVETTQSDRPDLKGAIDRLNETYSDDWRDPANDANLLDEDVLLAQILRTVDGSKSEQELKIKELESKLSELEPQVNEFKTAQEQERERLYTETLETSVQEYRAEVEKKALPKLFEDKGLTDDPNDTEGIKSIKNVLRSQFESKYGLESEFDRFVSHESSFKDQIETVARRVGKYLTEAASAATDPKLPKTDRERNASALKAKARDDQAALAVLHQKAAKEFLEKSNLSAVMKVVEENADLQRRLTQVTGRKEVVGHTVTAAGSTWRDRLKDDPDSINDVLADRFQAIAR